MLKHLLYAVPNNYKVGYGALFTPVFKDFGVDFTNVPVLAMRKDDPFGEARLSTLHFNVQEGYVVEGDEEKCKGPEPLREKITEKGKQKFVVKRKTKREEPTTHKKPRSSPAEEQETKKKKRKRIVSKKSVGQRKSQRVSAKQKGTTKVKVVLDATESESEKTVQPGTAEQRPYHKGTKEQDSPAPTMKQLEKLVHLSMIKTQDLTNAVQALQESLMESQQRLREELQTRLASLQGSLESQISILAAKVDDLTVEEDSDTAEGSSI